MSRSHIEIISYAEMQELEAQGGFVFHGSPVLPEHLEPHSGVIPRSLMPLHTPRNYNRHTSKHEPRDPSMLARVSFFDLLAPATARAIFHANNHTTLAPVDCSSGYDVDDNNGLHLKSTRVMLADTLARGLDLRAAAYAAPQTRLQQSPDDLHDYWSEVPVQPEYASYVDGTYVKHLASLCVSGAITIIPPFMPDFNIPATTKSINCSQ